MRRLRRLLVGLGAFAALCFAPSLFAADKGGMTRHEAEAASPSPVSWTGCGIGGRLGWGDAVTDTIESGISLGTTGEKVGLLGFCDYRFHGTPFVVGAEVSYDWVFGAMKTLGVDTDLGLGARGGMLINSGALLYGYAGWTRLDANNNSMSLLQPVNGWKVGPGIELRLASTPLFVDARVTYGTYSSAIPTGPRTSMDLHSYDAMVSLKYKFGMGE